MAKLLYVLQEELSGVRIRLFLVELVLSFIPAFVGGRIRVRLLRMAGFHIGKKSVVMGGLRYVGNGSMIQNLNIGPSAFVNVDCFFDLAAPIHIGKNVAIGPQVMLITGAHRMGNEHYRVGTLNSQAITIGDGVWLGARSVILPGVSIGNGAVVAAGAVVTEDVLPNTLVAGVPAKVIKELPTSDGMSISANGG